MNKYKLLIKNVGLFTIGSFGSKLVSFLLVPLYTAILSTTDYGTVDLLYSTSSMLTPLLLLSIQDATLRFGMDTNYDKKDVISTTFKTIYIGSLLLLGIVICAIFMGLISFPPIYYIFFFFTFTVGAMNNCASLYLKTLNKASIIAMGGVICTFLTCICNVLYLVIFKFGINGYLFSNIVGLGAQFFYQFIQGKIYKDLRFRNYKSLFKPMVDYSSPLIANSVAWWINNASDRYILTWLCGISVNGIYSVSYKIPTILTTLQSIFYNAWSISAISEFDKDDKDKFLGNNYTLFSLLSIMSASFIMLNNKILAKVLYSGEFYEAWSCVPFLMVATIFNGISQFEGSFFAAVRETKKVALTTIIGAFVNICLNFICIYYWKEEGAAFATLVGYFIMWLLRTIYLQKIIKLNVNWEKHICIIILIIIQAFLATLDILSILQISICIVIVLIYIPEITMFVKIINQKIKK